jgi:hypothetical protein
MLVETSVAGGEGDLVKLAGGGGGVGSAKWQQSDRPASCNVVQLCLATNELRQEHVMTSVCLCVHCVLLPLLSTHPPCR